MKKYLVLICWIAVVKTVTAQEVLRLKNGATVTVQNGAELILQGGITLENGSLLVNNGTTRLVNNIVASQSDWKDNSVIGALGGTGLVIFNSNLLHQYLGPTHFFNVQINTGGLTINNPFTVDNQLHLIKGKINTATNYVFLANNNTASLFNDASNTGYSNSWINGNFRRLITTNTNSYDFPVGNSTRCNLLQFVNNNVSGTNYLTASFGPKPGTDAGLNVVENMTAYTAVNTGGVWRFVPDASASGGNYALQLYFNGFTGLSDNMFGMLRRPDAGTNAADWVVPAGSSLEPLNGLGRKLSDGFARRFNISEFSQWGIGMMGTVPCLDCPTACTYSQGFYGNKNGIACFNNSGTSISSTQLMLNAFGATTAKVFGNVANRRFFTLYKTDISNGNIFKMLPGSGNSQPIAVDNILPYDGAYYANQSTWYLVPIQSNGQQKGKINNQLLSQLMTLWFNLQTSNSLASIGLSNDTLVTVAQTACGSGVASGNPIKFGLPHNVAAYLNGGNGYTNNVTGLYQLANDVLGGVNTAINALDVQLAVAAINSAFDGCRILTGTIPYIAVGTFAGSFITRETPEVANGLDVIAYPNPSANSFTVLVQSNTKEKIAMQVVDMYGRIIETRNVVANSITRFGDRYRPGTYFVRIIQGKEHKEIKLVKLSE